LLDQYTGSTANGRYTYAGGLGENYNTSGTLQDQDIYNIVYAAASQHGTRATATYTTFFLPAESGSAAKPPAVAMRSSIALIMVLLTSATSDTPCTVLSRTKEFLVA